ncbi:MAG: hypothetical protein ACYCYC_12415 [Bellilinea sp.]
MKSKGLTIPGKFIFTTGEDCFKSAAKFAPGQENTPVADKTFQTDIGSQADNPPVVAPAWMWFSHPQDILQAQVWQHAAIIPPML